MGAVSGVFAARFWRSAVGSGRQTGEGLASANWSLREQRIQQLHEEMRAWKSYECSFGAHLNLCGHLDQFEPDLPEA